MVSIAADTRMEPLSLEEVECSNVSDEEQLVPTRRAPSAGARRAAAAAAFGVVLLAAALAVAAWVASSRSASGRGLRTGSIGSQTQLSEDAATLGKELFDAHQDFFDFSGKGNSSQLAEGAAVANVPAEDMHDGNICDDDEELFAKLCYKKCSLLTRGEYPKRTTAWSCCASDGSEKCGFFNQKLSVRICGGFDVSGDRAGNGCPHPAGACLENEEVHLGRCFKKCGILTDGEYPTRIAAATCCKATEEWKCLDIMNVKTRKEFDVGGGAGDGDKRTPRGPHWPRTAWTEQKHKK